MVILNRQTLLKFVFDVCVLFYIYVLVDFVDLTLGRVYICRGVVWGIEGKQVGSMSEEPQVRGCYNFYLYTNQPGNCVCIGKDTSKQNI